MFFGEAELTLPREQLEIGINWKLVKSRSCGMGVKSQLRKLSRVDLIYPSVPASPRNREGIGGQISAFDIHSLNPRTHLWICSQKPQVE